MSSNNDAVGTMNTSVNPIKNEKQMSKIEEFDKKLLFQVRVILVLGTIFTIVMFVSLFLITYEPC